MHYVIFGKYHLQNKPLNSTIKAYIWDKMQFVKLFAQKYLHHKSTSNQHTQDVFFLEKVKMYRLDENQYEKNGDVIMTDPTKIYNYKYSEIEIQNISLNGLCEKLQDTNITVQIINL